jgi:hypothetical protein
MRGKATFNNISAISWRSVLLVEETRGHGKHYRIREPFLILLWSVVVVIVWQLDLQLDVQSLPITTKVVS